MHGTMKKKYLDSFFRKIDSNKACVWHLLLCTCKSSGIMCGVKKDKFDMVKLKLKKRNL
jgi:hypothetical protein